MRFQANSRAGSQVAEVEAVENPMKVAEGQLLELWMPVSFVRFVSTFSDVQKN